jgi:hypothetical protein
MVMSVPQITKETLIMPSAHESANTTKDQRVLEPTCFYSLQDAFFRCHLVCFILLASQYKPMFSVSKWDTNI